MEKEFIWSEDYSVHNTIIDEQHQTFLRIANELIALSTAESPDAAVVIAETAKLGEYASFHLTTEEDMFEKYGYPEAPEHIAAHNVFRDEAMRMLNEAKDGEGKTAEEAKQAAEFAGNWLLTHIMVMDKKYAQFFLDQGLD